MRNHPQPPRISLRYKLILAQLAVVILVTIIAEIGGLFATTLILGQPIFTPLDWGLHLVIALSSAGALGLILGAGISYLLTYRINQVLDASRAWMRGNLALRITDLRNDEIGQLSHQLNLLAEHLAEDEEDLRELSERNMRLSDQVRALAVVEERNRLARELHDSVKQNLFSMAMTASAIRTRSETTDKLDDDILEMIQEVESRAKAAQQEMTRLIEDLRPESIHSQGLAEALNDYALLFGAREHLLIYVDVLGNDKLLPPAIAEALYRVAQEALHNVARHARATRVDIDLRCIPEQVSLTIEDNGVGFNTDEAHEGLGLENMRERVMEVGGVLSIDSQPGIGTTIVAEVSLPHPLGFAPDQAAKERRRPIPSIENWAWLGQKLTIPVGQTWPWHPADQVHLRHPLVETPPGERLCVKHHVGFLGLRRCYSVQLNQAPALVRVHCGTSGYEWEAQGASWALRNVRGVSGRMILTYNGQPLAAIQQQGRMLHTWTEIVYDGRGYRLYYAKDHPGGFVLEDEAGDILLSAQDSDPEEFELHRPLPLPLLVMVTMRIADEVVMEAGEQKQEE